MIITEHVNSIMAHTLIDHSETERAVEIPFVFSILPEPSIYIRVLDIGCCESTLVMDLSTLGFDAWGVDMRDYGVPYNKFIKADARNMPQIPTSSFDIVLAISTVEHVGLVKTPYLTDKTFDLTADKKVFNEMVRIAKPNGIIVVTVPYGDGEASLKDWIRFYNKHTLSELLTHPHFVINKVKYSIYTNNNNINNWVETTEQECAKSYSKYGPKSNPIYGNVCISGHKK